jgi:hypothetical protein
LADGFKVGAQIEGGQAKTRDVHRNESVGQAKDFLMSVVPPISTLPRTLTKLYNERPQKVPPSLLARAEEVIE